MEQHFRAFSFVDRITAIQPGVRIQGTYTIPAGLETFPASLVSEAVGQLAAWAAMATVDFERRPVAGLAARVELLAAARPGQKLELGAQLESVDADAVSYSGSAMAEGVCVVRLTHCVGPMVPVHEFDDSQAVRNRFALLRGSGAVLGGFGGVPPLALDRNGGETGQWRRATLRVPTAAAFFADHFPRRPVFPGSLLMHANLQLASALAAEIPPPAEGGAWRIQTITDMKLRAFIPPGETLALEARVEELTGQSALFTVETRNGKRAVGGARVQLTPATGQ